MLELKDKILNRMGVAEAMGHRATESARRLQQAAHKHHDAANAEIADLARQIEAKGVGQDEELEQRYCRALVTRSHMIQAGHLAQQDAGKMPEVGGKLEKGRLAKLEAAGQQAMGFEEDDHPRAEHVEGNYKPGEFVPKGEAQGKDAEEQPTADKQPWEMHLDEMPSISDFGKKERANYFDEEGNKKASSREVPQAPDDTPLGTWRKDDSWKGSYGTDIEQLRELDPNDIIPSEDTGPERKGDVERYTEWAKEGRPVPPIKVVETDNGKMKVYDGHRRWLAAKKAGTKIRAWVSPSATIPGKIDSEGRPMKTGLTHELAIHHAIEAGHRVSDHVLADHPELKEQHDRKRKEMSREAGDRAEEAGFPGLAEAHNTTGPDSPAFKKWFGHSEVVDDQGQPLQVYHGTQSEFDAFDADKLGGSSKHPTSGLGFFFSESHTVARTFSGEKLRSDKAKDIRQLGEEHYGKPYDMIHDQDARKRLRQMHDEQPTVVVEEGEKPPNARVLPCYLSLQNPYRMPMGEWMEKFANPFLHQDKEAVATAVEETRKRLEAQGYDGIILDKHPTIDAKDRPTNEYSARSYIAFKPEQIKSADNEGTFDPNDPKIHKAIASDRDRPFVPPDMPRWRNGRPEGDAYLPLNGVEDRYKFRAMVEEMEKGTWKWSKPLIRCGDQLLTGSHRYAASKVAGTPLELMDVDDLFREGGLDFKETWEAHAQPWSGWLSNMDFALKCLPVELLEKYGIDLG
jgi:hypothetical protein